ncbi:MAG: penicillin-binding protein 1C, partial [Bacteroidetes bacterium]|nr:penicillin-binding protein 1C [Bacteroidota bacterium]
INFDLQNRINEIVEAHHQQLMSNDINNVAALVMEVKTGNVLTYVGNTTSPGKAENGTDVDVIPAPRSTGSILKPFLYAAMLNDGEILPNTLVPDVPTQISGYAPENYNKTYDGAIPAKRALARSLNVPAVWMLQSYGAEKFNYVLKKLGMTTLKKPASHYGLSIILGGAEGCLWDIAGIYGSMARTLNNYNLNNNQYSKSDFHPPIYIAEENDVKINNKNKGAYYGSSYLSAASIWSTFEAMVEVSRPEEEMEWQQFASSSKIAWKTGTSFGYRDGWAVGVNPQFVVAVWVGNADGEGRPGLTGIQTAAPIMFDIFKILKPSEWFGTPINDMQKITVCKYSGYKASPICELIDTVWVPKSGVNFKLCPFHQIINLDKSENYRVTSECESVSNMVQKSWFILPPVQEAYFKLKNPYYKSLPPFRDDCKTENSAVKSMEIVYPQNLSKIYIPYELEGTQGKTIFKVVHRNADAVIFWHVDDKYIGKTSGFHQMGFTPEIGQHKLTLVDQNGETLTRRFQILGKAKK